MRLAEVKKGKRFSLKHRLMKWMIDFTAKGGTPDIILTLMYQNHFFGQHMSALFDELMRGESELSIMQRELIAAVVSEANECPFCTKMHTSTVSLQGSTKNEDFTTDLQEIRKSVDPKFEALLELAQKLATSADDITKADIDSIIQQGFSKSAIEDTIHIVYAFCLINRIANALDFEIPPESGYKFSAKILLSKGYRI